MPPGGRGALRRFLVALEPASTRLPAQPATLGFDYVRPEAAAFRPGPARG